MMEQESLKAFDDDPTDPGSDGDNDQNNEADSDDKYPIEDNGVTLYGLPKCPECGEVGSYCGTGSTTVSNWTGKSFSRYHCGPCDRSFNVHASANESPTI